MKINEVFSVAGQYNQSRVVRREAQKQLNLGQDSIELSSFAGAYSEAMAAARKNAAAVDEAYEARVQAAAERCRDGAYEVSAMEVSMKMLYSV